MWQLSPRASFTVGKEIRNSGGQLAIETELEQKCCEAGLRENPVGLSCKERIQHVRHGPVCITAFLSCCQLSETLTREAREEQLLLGTSEGAMAGGTGLGGLH